VANPARDKGTKWETAVVAYLVSCGLSARRKAQAGNKDTGDIEVPSVPGVVIEAKNCKGQTLAQWVDEAVTEAQNAGVPVGAVWHRRRLSPRLQATSPGTGYVTMSGEHFARLLARMEVLERAYAGGFSLGQAWQAEKGGI
jgi:hypothetical protein